MTIEEMAELAKRHQLVNEVHKEADHYRLEIGAGVFRLKPEEARKLLENMLRQYSGDVE